MTSRPSPQPTPDLTRDTYYSRLGLQPWASEREIRLRYRELSKLYHPDTTTLPQEQAVEQFRRINEAYAVLSSAERRTLYDRQLGFARVYVAQAAAQAAAPSSSSAYLDATDRPLSPGELFALVMLGLTFVACLALAVVVAVVRGQPSGMVLAPGVVPTAVQSAPSRQSGPSAPSPAPQESLPSGTLESGLFERSFFRRAPRLT